MKFLWKPPAIRNIFRPGRLQETTSQTLQEPLDRRGSDDDGDEIVDEERAAEREADQHEAADPKVIIGKWLYKDEIGISQCYEVSYDNAVCKFKESGNGAEGILQFGLGWWEGDLNYGSIKIGTIRLRLISENLVSHFRNGETEEWDEEVKAVKALGEAYWSRVCLESLLLILVLVWFVLILRMTYYAIHKLNQECTVTHYLHKIGTWFCGLSLALQLLSVLCIACRCNKRVEDYQGKRFFQYCNEFIFSSDWRYHAFQRRLSSAQIILQAIGAFAILPSFVFNVLGLSLRECLFNHYCTTGLEGNTQPLTWMQNVVVSFPERATCAKLGGTLELVHGNHSEIVPWQSNLCDNGFTSVVKVAVDVAEPWTVIFLRDDVLQLQFLAGSYFVTLLFLYLYANIFQTWRADLCYDKPPCYVGLGCLDALTALGIMALTAIAAVLNQSYADPVFVIPTAFGVAALIHHFGFIRERRKMKRSKAGRAKFKRSLFTFCKVFDVTPDAQEKTSTIERRLAQSIVNQMLRITLCAGFIFSTKICVTAKIWPGDLNDLVAEWYLTYAILVHLALTMGYFRRIRVQLDFEELEEAYEQESEEVELRTRF